MDVKTATEARRIIKGIPEQDHLADMVRFYMEPGEAAKLIRPLNRMTIFMSLEGALTTEVNEEEKTSKAYQIGGNIKVARTVACGVLCEWECFNTRKAEMGQKIGYVKITVSRHCLFIY